jgi:formylglycine-generating enzyme
VDYVSFWNAARFCNWLHNGQDSGDTETGAYLNIGNQTAFARQPGAKYFIPTENEWYKAAYFDPNKGGAGLPGYWDYPTKSDIPPVNTLITPDPGNHANYLDDYGTGNGGWMLGSPYFTTLVGDFENSASVYGTFDQGGNLWEWETPISAFAGSQRGLRGGYWGDISMYLPASNRDRADPTYVVHYIGFRVASVPEPGSITLLVAGAIGLLAYTCRRRKAA